MTKPTIFDKDSTSLAQTEIEELIGILQFLKDNSHHITEGILSEDGDDDIPKAAEHAEYMADTMTTKYIIRLNGTRLNTISAGIKKRINYDYPNITEKQLELVLRQIITTTKTGE